MVQGVPPVKKTTTVTGPDGSVTTTKTTSSGGCSGCGTFLVIAFALGLMIEAWQGSSILGRIGEIALVAGLGIVALEVNRRRQARKDPR